MGQEHTSEKPFGTRRQIFAIKGMSCAACSNRLQRVLAATEGVRDVSVNLASESMDITWNPDKLTPDQIAEKVKQTGFEVVVPSSTVMLDLGISGMTCAACVRRVENALTRLEGVDKAQVNLATETAKVHYDPSLVGPRDIRQSVEQTGYGAQVISTRAGTISEHQQKESLEKLSRLRKRLIP
ncbi:MAG: copper ion binding protein, partial [Desulfovibrionales bacterium]